MKEKTPKLEIAWVDKQGMLHIEIPNVIQMLGLPDSPEMRNLVAEELAEIISITEESPLVIVRDYD